MKQFMEIHTRDGRVGTVTRLDADLVWGKFAIRPEGGESLEEEVFVLDQVTILPRLKQTTEEPKLLLVS